MGARPAVGALVGAPPPTPPYLEVSAVLLQMGFDAAAQLEHPAPLGLQGCLEGLKRGCVTLPCPYRHWHRHRHRHRPAPTLLLLPTASPHSAQAATCTAPAHPCTAHASEPPCPPPHDPTSELQCPSAPHSPPHLQGLPARVLLPQQPVPRALQLFDSTFPQLQLPHQPLAQPQGGGMSARPPAGHACVYTSVHICVCPGLRHLSAPTPGCLGWGVLGPALTTEACWGGELGGMGGGGQG